MTFHTQVVGRQRPAPGDVHRADGGPRRGDPRQLPVRPERRDARLLGLRADGRADRDGHGRAGPRPAGRWRSPRSPSRWPAVRITRAGPGCSTTPTSSSTCARRPATRSSVSTGSTRPIGPGSTVANAAIVNEIKVQTAAILLEAGALPPVLTSGAVVGAGALGRAVRGRLPRARPPRQPGRWPAPRRPRPTPTPDGSPIGVGEDDIADRPDEVVVRADERRAASGPSRRIRRIRRGQDRPVRRRARSRGTDRSSSRTIAGSTGSSMRSSGSMPLALNRSCHVWGIVRMTSPPTSSVQCSRCRNAAASSRVR